MRSRVFRAVALSLKPVPWMVVAGLSSVYRCESFGFLVFAGFAIGFVVAERADFLVAVAVAIDLATLGIFARWHNLAVLTGVKPFTSWSIQRNKILLFCNHAACVCFRVQ